MDTPHELAEAETYLIQVLERSDPPRDPGGYNVTAAARECHAIAGDWDLQRLGMDAVEEVLARHPAAD
jgi:hypothetical protein